MNIYPSKTSSSRLSPSSSSLQAKNIKFFYIYFLVAEIDYQGQLLKDLFSKYDKRIRPMANEKRPLPITGTMLGAILIQVDESKQMSSYVATRRQNWTDPRLKWNPAKYDDTTEIFVPSCDIWRPDIFAYNSIAVENLVPEAKDWAKGNTEWEVENVSIISFFQNKPGVWGEEGDKYKYIFQLRRRPTYYISVIVIPTFLVTAASIVGIFAPGTEHDSGDVANLGLATLLALMVLLGIVSEKLPKSEEMSLLGTHILIILLVFVLCVLLEMASLYYFLKMADSGKRPPEWLINFSKLNFLRSKNKRKVVPKSNLSYRSSSVSSVHQLENGINPRNYSTTGSTNSFSSPNVQGKNLIRNFLNNEKKSMKKWKHIIDEFKAKNTEERNKIRQEWNKIEERLDFIWIFIFEGANVLNLFSLYWFAHMPTPEMGEWL